MIVLLHPVGLDRECWALTDLVGAAFEYPGHGSRSGAAGGMSLESIADELVAEFDGPLDLVGVSMGSAVAQYAAIRHPDRVASMVLGAAGAPRAAAAGPNPVHRSRSDEALRLGMAATLQSTLERWFTPDALADPTHPGIAYVRRRWLANDPRAIAATWLALGNAATRDRLSALAMPVTIVPGSRDLAAGAPGRSVETARELAKLIPNARVDVIDGPHMLALERPAEFAAAVRRHLDWSRGFDRGAPVSSDETARTPR